MDDREVLRGVRGFVARRDASGLVAALHSSPWPPRSLQLIGEGLLVAIGSAVEGSHELGLELTARLAERAWDGDQELIDLIESVMGTGPTPMLRPLPVDLEELAEILEGDLVRGGGRIDLSTGEVWPQPTWDYVEEIGEDLEDDDAEANDTRRWLWVWVWVEPEGSRAGYQDMEWFFEHLADPDLADHFRVAITGRGAFGRFKGSLSRWSDLMTRWHAFSADRQRGRARRWLADNGYTTGPSAA